MIWQSVTLGNRVRHDADRVGGCELVLPWPNGLPLGRPLALDMERDTSPREHAIAEDIVRDACRAAGLVCVRSAAAMLRRPHGVGRPRVAEQHLIVVLVGRRWIGATGVAAARPALRWHPIERIERIDDDRR